MVATGVVCAETVAIARIEVARRDLNCILIDNEGVFVIKQTSVGYQFDRVGRVTVKN